MSFTRLEYDTCAYAKELQESTTPLEYLMFRGKYENCKNCPDNTNNLEFGMKVDNETFIKKLKSEILCSLTGGLKNVS